MAFTLKYESHCYNKYSRIHFSDMKQLLVTNAHTERESACAVLTSSQSKLAAAKFVLWTFLLIIIYCSDFRYIIRPFYRRSGPVELWKYNILSKLRMPRALTTSLTRYCVNASSSLRHPLVSSFVTPWIQDAYHQTGCMRIPLPCSKGRPTSTR